MSERQRILITGGAGFIGTHLIARLRNHHDVMSFDCLHPQVHGEAPGSFEVPTVIGDIADFEAVSRTVAEFAPTVIYHLAAETGTGQSWHEPVRYCDTNVTGTANLIQAVRQSGPNVHSVIAAGSRAVYGEGAYLDNGETVCGEPRKYADLARGDFAVRSPTGKVLQAVPTPETLREKPASVYASTKLMQEQLLQQCFDGQDVQVHCLRFQNVYGIGQSLNNPYTGIISIFSKQILAGEGLSVFEDGNIVRDMVHVSDAVEALAQFAGGRTDCGITPINIGSGRAITILEIATTLLTAFGRDPEDLQVTGEFRAGDVRHAVADDSRARSMLDWSAQVSFSDGIREFVEWVRSGNSDIRTEAS
jgi:dTDP-L-rhamnose 4-epimerase